MKNYVFRVDASIHIGSGHVMRCLTLAEELQKHAGQILFVCRAYPGNLTHLIQQKGFKVISLAFHERDAYIQQNKNDDYAKWLWVTQEEDARQTISYLPSQVEFLIIDHYSLDKTWESQLRHYAKHIMVIDDLANRTHDCDLLLDQNYYVNPQNRYYNKLPVDCLTLVGPDYALLRKEFPMLRQNLVRQYDGVKRILVFLGGIDFDNLTYDVLKAIKVLNKGQWIVDVVVGSANTQEYKNMIQQTCESNCYYYHCQISNMAELMLEADFAIGAGGSTNWERCCLGLPALVVSSGENQEELAMNLMNYGAIRYMGKASVIDQILWIKHMNHLINDSLELQKMSQQGLALVDGQGIIRVIQAMIGVTDASIENR